MVRFKWTGTFKNDPDFHHIHVYVHIHTTPPSYDVRAPKRAHACHTHVGRGKGSQSLFG